MVFNNICEFFYNVTLFQSSYEYSINMFSQCSWNHWQNAENVWSRFCYHRERILLVQCTRNAFAKHTVFNNVDAFFTTVDTLFRSLYSSVFSFLMMAWCWFVRWTGATVPALRQRHLQEAADLSAEDIWAARSDESPRPHRGQRRGCTGRNFYHYYDFDREEKCWEPAYIG